MCLMDSQTKQIVEWEVDGVPPKHDDGLWLSMAKHLRKRPWLSRAQVTLIERQPERNRVMKQVERFVHGWMAQLGGEVILWDAKHKIPDICGPGKRQYTRRKNASMERCLSFIKEHNPRWVEAYLKHCKKDDMADTVMQGLSWINRIPSAKESKVTQEKRKQRPRKPTMNQKETKYSKANLAWCYLNDKMDKRFHKDLGRYYHTLQEMKEEFNLE